MANITINDIRKAASIVDADEARKFVISLIGEKRYYELLCEEHDRKFRRKSA